MSGTEKFIHINGKAQVTLNPEWIRQNYPDTYNEILKHTRQDERDRIRKQCEKDSFEVEILDDGFKKVIVLDDIDFGDIE